MESEGDVVAFGRAVAFDRFGRGRAGCSGRPGRTRSGGCAALTGTGRAAEKLNVFGDHAEFAALGSGLLVVPLIQLEPTFDHNRTALAHILPDVLRRAAKNIHVHKGDFFLLLTSFIRPDAVDREADLGDGRSFGRVAQFRITRQVAHQDDFVEAGHKIELAANYFAGFGSGTSVNSTRKTSSLSENFFVNCATIVGVPVKMTLA